MRALHNSWTRILSCSSVCLYTLLATLSSNLLPPHRQRSLYRKPSFSMIKQIGMHMLMHTCPENHEASTYCSRRRQGCLKFLLETSLHSTGPPVCSAVPAPARLTLWHDHPSPGREVLRRQKANQIRTIQQSKARRQEACRSSGSLSGMGSRTVNRKLQSSGLSPPAHECIDRRTQGTFAKR